MYFFVKLNLGNLLFKHKIVIFTRLKVQSNNQMKKISEESMYRKHIRKKSGY